MLRVRETPVYQIHPGGQVAICCAEPISDLTPRVNDDLDTLVMH